MHLGAEQGPEPAASNLIVAEATAEGRRKAQEVVSLLDLANPRGGKNAAKRRVCTKSRRRAAQ